MQDMCLLIAKELARPLKTQGGTLYQLWRVDFKALMRLALVCRAADAAVKELLWTCSELGARELRRQRQTELAHAFLRQQSLIASTNWWTHPERYPMLSTNNGHAYVRVQVSVGFNGRICIKEYKVAPHPQCRLEEGPTGCLSTYVGMTLSGPEEGGVLIMLKTKRGRTIMWRAKFTDSDGALGSLRIFTLLGRQRWEQTQPAEHARLVVYDGVQPVTNLTVEPPASW